MAPHSSTLAWKIPWTEEPGRLQSMGSLRVGHNWATSLSLFTFTHWRRKWQPTPVFSPGESQGRGSLVGCCLRGRRVGHDWSDLAAAAAAICVWFFHRLFHDPHSDVSPVLLEKHILLVAMDLSLSFQAFPLCVSRNSPWCPQEIIAARPCQWTVGVATTAAGALGSPWSLRGTEFSGMFKGPQPTCALSRSGVSVLMELYLSPWVSLLCPDVNRFLG